ncbi:MAG: hypothetical protein Sylvanvirus7_31 [Sylvanvirus sp.]|uniref:Uncharacterized protein n=1 Tax=Sylvanvirus sp. TaxID=2487774 RepID=A0A3G5AKF6_9VIRU|nr:MAG: hypothetical protein Sylvanvirus7_31 [Sylvanvirus sp.]
MITTSWADICEDEQDDCDVALQPLNKVNSETESKANVDIFESYPHVWIIFKDTHDFSECLRFGSIMEDASDFKLRHFIQSNPVEYAWYHAYDPLRKHIIHKPKNFKYTYRRIEASEEYRKRADKRVSPYLTQELRTKYAAHFTSPIFQSFNAPKRHKKKVIQELKQGEEFDMREEEKGTENKEIHKEIENLDFLNLLVSSTHTDLDESSKSNVVTKYIVPNTETFIERIKNRYETYKETWSHLGEKKEDHISPECLQFAIELLIKNETQDDDISLVILTADAESEAKRLRRKVEQKKKYDKLNKAILGLRWFIQK